MEQRRLLIDVVTDVVCPWCYVGLRSALKAHERLARDFDAYLRLRPYQLGPHTPEEGLDRNAYYQLRFPDPVQREASRNAIAEAARRAGFDFDPGVPTRLPNTLKAHQAMRLAATEGAAIPYARALYDAYWLHDAPIGDIGALAAIAESAGLDGSSFRLRMESGEKLAETAADAKGLCAAGVSGVPTFIVNERRGFSGALPPQELEAAILEAARFSREMSS
ncbi:MAG: DsbA family oxidoreductase [Parvularculaceae bacterium]|jgi:predicted DsbA family dithiol-disulfide isomerase|nr:DsbA family oxidoreductase [Parvularculaceae bacterium]